MPSSQAGAEPLCISGVTGGSQQLTALEAEVSLTGNDWQKHPVVTGPEALCILGIDYLRRGYFKDPKGYRWAFGTAALETEEIKQLSTLPSLSEDPSVVGLLRVEEQQVPTATTMVHQRQYHTNQDSLIPIHELILQLESQGVISKTRSAFNRPIWPVRKSNGEWRLIVDSHGLKEVMLLLSAAVPGTLELQYKLESKQPSDIAAQVEKLVVKVRHIDAHVPQSWATEEHQNNRQMDQAAKIEVVQVGLDWQQKGQLFIAWWAHDTSRHQGTDATYIWARDRGADLTMDTIAQVIHECETCAAIKQAKQLKPLWYGVRWLKYKYGEAWQIDHITFPQTCQRKRHVLTMVEATTRWKHIPCPMPLPGTLSWALKSKSYEDYSCGGLLSSPSGTLQSPFYPRNYPNNANCVWEIEVKSNFHVTLAFKDVQMEGGRCLSDYVEVYDGPLQTSPPLGKFCSGSFCTYTSSSNLLTVRFYSNSRYTYRGVQAAYYSTPADQSTTASAKDTVYLSITFSSHFNELVTYFLCHLLALLCSPDYMHAVVSRYYLQSQGYSAWKLSLNDPSCKPSITSEYVIFDVPYTRCGTVREGNNNRIIYSNLIRGSSSGALITGNKNLHLHITCKMLQNTWEQIMYVAEDNFEVNETQYGRYDVNLTFYHSASFSWPVNDSPYYTDINQNLFLEAYLHSSDSNLVLFVDMCGISHSPQFYDSNL
ncbi:hypothetical protein QYF61_009455 [Mycteria americana]|uniref:CUB domain-containing protein n=1 Tax=Mycteria americana TaxID=33587 RepID=A0AAN7NAC9_MYCAM|nr:hypothetical protein QYF61_009455 [Mycteria americana]